jgi:nicotinic acid mononucleotide adenylyltransferase
MFKGIPKYLDICIKNRSGFDEKIQSLIKGTINITPYTRLKPVLLLEQAVAEAIENSLFVDAEILDISSTAIRKAVQTGESLEST